MKVEEFIAVTVNVPIDSAEQVRNAIASAGGGIIGNYKTCSFSIRGTGRSEPVSGSKPTYGSMNELSEKLEEKIETFCAPEKLEKILNAILASHPYDEPAIIYFPIKVIRK